MRNQRRLLRDLDSCELRPNLEATSLPRHELRFNPTIADLFHQHDDFLSAMVEWLAKHFGFSRQDKEDAHQEAVLAFLEAVARYDTARAPASGSRAFRSYLFLVLRNRLQDWMRPMQWWDDHLDCHARVEEVNSGGHRGDHGPRSHPTWAWGCEVDPAEAALHDEDLLLMASVIRELSPKQFTFLVLLLTKKPLKRIALDMRVSFPTIRRWRKKLIVFLSKRLGALGVEANSALLLDLSFQGHDPSTGTHS